LPSVLIRNLLKRVSDYEQPAQFAAVCSRAMYASELCALNDSDRCPSARRTFYLKAPVFSKRLLSIKKAHPRESSHPKRFPA
jgi:hypothetical protein